MYSEKKDTSCFDDDFEVTYEDEITFDYHTSRVDFDTQELAYDDYDNDYDDYENDNYTDYADYEGEDYNDYADYENEDYNDSTDYEDEDYKRRSRRRYRPTRLAAPIQKGGNAILGIARTLIRNLTIFLMLGILIFMGYNFYKGSIPYGDIEHAISTNTYTQMMTAYFSVAALLLLYEIFSILWAMTKVRVRDRYGVHREDVGRGLASFIWLYIFSYAAFFVNRWIPESMDILKGIKGALDVFGSMHNVLFGLCLAGVVSCLFRKYSLTL